jgi:polysaccharide biosynthesis transport protein
MTASPTETSVQLPGRGIQPLDSLHNHARLVVLIFLIVTLLGLPVVLIKGQPSYQTTATVQVSPRYMKTLRDDIELEFQSNAQYLQFIEQQARTINRYDVIELALQRLDGMGEGADLTSTAGEAMTDDLQRLDEAGERAHPWRRTGESDRRSIERLQRSLDIRPVRNTYLIQVSLVAAEPDGIEDVLNAVVAAYLERAREEQVFAADQRVESLKRRESELLEQIESMTRERTLIGQELGVTAFNPDDVNPFDRRARQLQENHLEARIHRIEAQARLDAFLAQGETDTAMRSIQETLLSDPGLNSLKASLNQRRAELLAITSGLSSTHPAYLDAQDELAGIEREISGRETDLREKLSSGVESRHRTAASQALEIETQLERMLTEVTDQAGTYAEGFNRAGSLNNHLRLLWSELDQVRDRLNFFEGEEASPGFLRLVTPALAPLYPTGTGKKKLLLMVLVAAVALSLAAPIVIDLLDRRVRTVNDVHRTLGFPPLGWIVDAMDPDRLLLAEDQLRRLASGLIRDGNRHATRTIVLTSVRPGGGTTWIARSLTRTLNRLGFPTLVVEANAYHPDSVYGPGPGLVSVLAGDSSELHLDGTDPEIPSMPVGSSAGNRALGNLHRLQSVLQAIPERYRFVIVDAPPLLASSDGELIAGAADAVLLVAEAGGIGRGELDRAGRLLRGIDPPVVGTVVNRINPFRGGGYVTALVEEHRSGRKVQPASLSHAIRGTMAELIRAPFVMVWDVLSLPFAAIRRGQRASAPAPEREER